MSRIRLVLALPLLSLAASPLHASSTLVPDNFATIQLAINSGADTVIVKGGTYEEDLVTPNEITLLAYEGQFGMGTILQLPVVGGLTAQKSVNVRGFHFRGPVSLAGTLSSSTMRFESCRFDAGMATTTSIVIFLYVRGCVFLADADLYPYTCEFVNNTFIGAQLTVSYEGYAHYLSNVFTGPAAYGLSTSGSEGGVLIKGNRVTGTATGIVVTNPSGVDVVENEVEDCAGDAFAVSTAGVGGAISFERNRVRNCGGTAFSVSGVSSEFIANAVDSVGGHGMHVSGFPVFLYEDNEIRHAGGHGLFSDRSVFVVSGNTIADVGMDGLAFESSSNVISNVVGRAGGVGIRITDGFGASLLHNTIYDCTGHGIEITDSNPDSIRNNIAYRNGGAGFAWLSAGTPHLACNDWFDNAGGATSGVAPGTTDLAVHPLFCDIANDDVSLSAASPLVNAAGCGQIGALGQGCAVAVGVDPQVSGDLSGIRVYPQPARGFVTFAWPGAESATRVEVFDISGARRWSADLAPGAQHLEWGFTGASGHRLPPGIYMARFERSGEVHSRKIVLAR